MLFKLSRWASLSSSSSYFKLQTVNHSDLALAIKQTLLLKTLLSEVSPRFAALHKDLYWKLKCIESQILLCGKAKSIEPTEVKSRRRGINDGQFKTRPKKYGTRCRRVGMFLRTSIPRRVRTLLKIDQRGTEMHLLIFMRYYCIANNQFVWRPKLPWLLTYCVVNYYCCMTSWITVALIWRIIQSSCILSYPYRLPTDGWRYYCVAEADWLQHDVAWLLELRTTNFCVSCFCVIHMNRPSKAFKNWSADQFSTPFVKKVPFFIAYEKH